MKFFKRTTIILLILGVEFFCGYKLTALAGEGDNLFGWAWNSQAGWISFNNCIYGETCSGYSYGVKLDEDDLTLSGYAWSDNVGWIKFDNSGTVGYSYPAGGFPQHGAKLDLDNRIFSGWAQILSLGDDGWVKLAKDSYDGETSNYNVSLELDGKLRGWAWNNMLGWISFNSADWTGNTIVYYVTGRAPFVPSNVTVTPDSLSGCDTLNINWQPSLYANTYWIYRAASSSFTPTTSNLVASTTNTNFSNNGLSLNTDYYYHIGASNFFGTVYTPASSHGRTRAICGIQIIAGQGSCLSGDPSIIKLNWQAPHLAPGVTIDHYIITRCQVTESEDCLRVLDSHFINIATTSDCYLVEPSDYDNPPPSVGATSTLHCIGNDCHCWETFTGDEVDKQYVYKIIGVDQYGQSGDETNPDALIQIFPCARQKSWYWEEQNPATSSP